MYQQLLSRWDHLTDMYRTITNAWWIGSKTIHTLFDKPFENSESRLRLWNMKMQSHYSDVIMSAVVSHITGVSIVYSTVCSVADQRKLQNSASLDFVRGIHRWPVNSPHKGPVTWKMFPFDDVIMYFSPLKTIEEVKTKDIMVMIYRNLVVCFMFFNISS